MNQRKFGLAGCLAAIALFSLCSCSSQQPAEAKETKNSDTKQDSGLQIGDAPAAVQKTVREQSSGGTLVGFTTEKEKGQVMYEAEMKFNGHAKNLIIDASGAVKEVEEETSLGALPSSVAAQVQKSAAKSKILAVESVTREGKLTGYELRVQDSKGKESELDLTTDGKVKAEEDGEDEEDEKDEK